MKIKNEFAVTASLGYVTSVEAQSKLACEPVLSFKVDWKSIFRFSFTAKRFLVFFAVNVFDFSVTYFQADTNATLPSWADLS